MKETIKGKIRNISIGEEKAVMKIEIDPDTLQETGITHLIGKEGIAISFDESQTTLDESQKKLEEENVADQSSI